MTRVLIVDDEPFARAGIRMLLSDRPDLEVVGEAHDGEQALELCQKLEPDVVVMDLQLPDLGGAEVTQRIRSRPGPDGRSSGPAVLALTSLGLAESLLPVLQAGATGYVLKDSPETIPDAVRAVASGRGWLDTAAVPAVISEAVRGPLNVSFGGARLAQLTSRERQVLTLAAQGYGNGQIAKELFICETTVKSHMSSVLLKLGVQDRTQAVILLLQSRETPASSARRSPNGARSGVP
jgi:DNA-binding NarL/FixJ family response regulator